MYFTDETYIFTCTNCYWRRKAFLSLFVPKDLDIRMLVFDTHNRGRLLQRLYM